MTIYVDQSQILKGNADLTVDAQNELQARLREQELRRQFPNFFTTPLTTPAATAGVETKL